MIHLVVTLLFPLLFPLAHAQELAGEVKAALDEARPDCTHEVLSPLELSQDCGDGDSARIYLENLRRRVESGEPGALASFVAVIASPAELDPLAPVMPVVRHAATVTELESAIQVSGGSAQELLVTEPLAGPLVVVYVLDYPDRVAYLTREEADARFPTDQALRAEALDNLARLPIQREGGAESGMWIADGSYESSLLLLAPIWDSLAAEQQGDVVVVVPSREVIVFTWTSDRRSVRRIRRLGRRAHAEAPYPLSAEMLRWTGSAWVVH